MFGGSSSNNLATISVNFRDHVCLFVRLFEYLLLPNGWRYQNINGTILSQIVWVIFFAHYCLPKVAKNYQQKSKNAGSEGRLNWLVGITFK